MIAPKEFTDDYKVVFNKVYHKKNKISFKIMKFHVNEKNISFRVLGVTSRGKCRSQRFRFEESYQMTLFLVFSLDLHVYQIWLGLNRNCGLYTVGFFGIFRCLVPQNVNKQ